MLVLTYLNNFKNCLSRGLFMVLVLTLLFPSLILAEDGCKAPKTPTPYSGVFPDPDFDKINILAGTNKLNTGAQSIDPNRIIIPFTQEVFVSFLYVKAGHISDMGWLLYSDCVNADGTFLGWGSNCATQICADKRHPIFIKVKDGNDDGGNGILDTEYGNGNFPIANETALSTYNDGTAYLFKVNGDGAVTTKDMKKSIGIINGGTEIVFFLTDNKRWTDNANSNVFFTKQAWNPDNYNTSYPRNRTPTYNYPDTFDRIYNLGSPGVSHGCPQSNDPCPDATSSALLRSNGWLDAGAITRISTNFGITLTGGKTISLKPGNTTKFPHVIVGAPPDDSNQWILGFEDLSSGGDYDINDLVFRIERQTGGSATLKTDKAITVDPNDYYTAVTIEVYDNMPGGACAGKTSIKYSVSTDNGAHWQTLFSRPDWDVVKSFTLPKVKGADVITPPWTFGNPALTYRSKRIDFSGLGILGGQLLWKAELNSNNETCVPEIIDVVLSGTVAAHENFSRASPSVQTNMLYSGFYETPGIDLPRWSDKTVLHGHLVATRLYDPANPENEHSTTEEIWDAGKKLYPQSLEELNKRKIYYPNITMHVVTDEEIGRGGASKRNFTGTLAHSPISPATIKISDQTETFTDSHTDVLTGNFGGYGTINRFSGEFDLTFTKPTPPGDNELIKASYAYYTLDPSNSVKEFTTTNVDNSMLGLDNTKINATIFKYDFNGDTNFSELDGAFLVNWVRGWDAAIGKPKEWPLGAIDHSVPAVQTSPGMPAWFDGTAFSPYQVNPPANYKNLKIIRDKFYKAPTIEEPNPIDFVTKEGIWNRRTVVYVGSRDGMIHAFDAGNFRWGYKDSLKGFVWSDNPKTPYDSKTNIGIYEYRGYFEWSGDTSATADYGTGEELWAFIPANLIARLKNNKLSGEDQAYVDASPSISDVYINGEWKTVLISAEGNGGDTVFCLDVTDPLIPKFLWEFADPDLFRSRSSPAISIIGQIAPGKWAAFFVSGKTNDVTMYPSVYVIDIENGSVIQRIFLGTDNALAKGGIPSGQPAVVDSDGDGFVDRMYIGTDKGFLYKVNIPDDPGDTSKYTQCVINTDASLSGLGRHPIYASPAVVVQTAYNTAGKIEPKVKIFFGTSDSPYITDYPSGTVYHFFAYVDNGAKGDYNSSNVKLDWFFPMPAGERIFASAFAAAGRIYFGTSTSETEDPCEGFGAANPPTGNLYVMKVEQTETPKAEFTISGKPIFTSPGGGDEHLYFRTSDGVQATQGRYNNPLPGGPLSSFASWREIFDKRSRWCPLQHQHCNSQAVYCHQLNENFLLMYTAYLWLSFMKDS